MVSDIQSYHYNRNYSIWGLVLLVAMAAGLYAYVTANKVSGGIYLATTPFLLGVFIMAYYTGQPCLVIHKTHLYYRRFPVGTSRIVVLNDIIKVDISGKEVRIFCAGQTHPVRIISATFTKTELPEITAYFQQLSEKVQLSQV